MRKTRGIRKSENQEKLDGASYAKVTVMGNIIEVLAMEKCPVGSPCRKVDKDHYVDLRNGELLEYEHIENRSGSMASVRRTLAKIRALINTNVSESENVRWVTLTYRENMTDTKQLYSDYFKFWKRFCYWCKKQGHIKPEYITVQEPQGRGAWHIHAFFIWPCKAPFVPNDVMSDLWQRGFTKTKALQDVDNVGAYFSAYLGDMPLDEVNQLPVADQINALAGGNVEEKEFSNEQGYTKKKKFVKGGRLFMYPPGMNIVRKTKGIRDPVIELMSFSDAEKKVCSTKQTFSVNYEIVDDSGRVVNVISKAYYNSKRK